MGSCTYVLHEGQKLRAWFLNDYQVRQVGDSVSWEPHFDTPGEWINGLHDAESEGELPLRDEYLVVIKNFVIADARAITAEQSREELTRVLKAWHGSLEPPRELWPAMAWEAAAWRKELREKLWADRKAKLVEQYMANWRLKQQQPRAIYKTGRAIPKSTTIAANAAIFESLVKEPETEEEAIKQAEAICAVNEFTRTKIREPGFYRLLTGQRDVRHDLTADAQASLFGWREWPIPAAMREDAARYKIERHLRELGKWDETKYWVICATVRSEALIVQIKELHGETRPAE